MLVMVDLWNRWNICRGDIRRYNTSKDYDDVRRCNIEKDSRVVSLKDVHYGSYNCTNS